MADEVLHQLPGVEAAFASDKVVADAGEGDGVNPGRVVVSLLEGGRDKGGRDIGVECHVIAAGQGNGADCRVWGQDVEGTLVRY